MVENKIQARQIDPVKVDRPLIIDVEASGFGRGSYPIEVGVALSDSRTHCRIIRPEPDWQHWDCSAEKLHGIARQVLIQHGCAVREVAQWLNDCLAGERVYSDAWGNDSSWLALLFDCAGVRQRFRLQPLYSLLSDSQISHWHNTKHAIVDRSGFTRHRASHDAFILQETYCVTSQL